MDVKELEALVVRTDPQIERERAAVAAGRWPQFLEERVPAPAVYHPRQRSAWRDALETAVAIGSGTVEREVLVFPVWFCSNDDDIPGSKWEPATMVAFDDGTFELHERKPAGAIAIARVEHARLGFLVRARDYAPGVPLAYRNDHFGAIESKRIDRVTGILRVLRSAEAAKPEHDLPPFAVDAVAARIAEDPEIGERMAAAIAKLRVFPDGPETLVAPLRR